MEIRKLNDIQWEIPKTGNMKVPVKIHASDAILTQMKNDRTFQQIMDVASLPGIHKHAVLMPDGHEGYGFPIGGVAAFNEETGIVSPGGIGYDINCGIRLMVSDLTINDIKNEIPSLLDALFKEVPSGLGVGAPNSMERSEFLEMVSQGVKWAEKEGIATKRDMAHIEENGSMSADTSYLSQKAIARGLKQVGTLGAGNHFLELQQVETLFGDEGIAEKFGLRPNQIVIMIHTGSRGFGHQVATDYIKRMLDASKKYNIKIPNKQLASAPLKSKESEDYLEAMKCAVNYAFVNRQKITHHTRDVFNKFFGAKLNLLYDVAHNIGKYEVHEGETLFIHRKGATRAFGPGRNDLPETFKSIGQPVITPGSMGTASYVLVGLGNTSSFESTCHGAGRVMGRSEAMRKLSGVSIKKQLEGNGISVRSGNLRNLAQEAPQVYKDIDDVVKTVDLARISAPVARLLPIGVVKG